MLCDVHQFADHLQATVIRQNLYSSQQLKDRSSRALLK